MLTTFHFKKSVNTPTLVTATAIAIVIANLTNTRVKIIKTEISYHDAQEAVLRDCWPRENIPYLKVGRNVWPENINLLSKGLATEK